MHKQRGDIIIVLIASGIFWTISFLYNEWLSETMPRHQTIQLPAMFLLGAVLGLRFSNGIKIHWSWGLAFLIFIMCSLIFWMLPHSIDYAVIHPGFNRVMHLNMLIAGFLFVPTMRQILFEIKIIFLGMVSAMIIATGIALNSFNILLCSAFDIAQQKVTGKILLISGLIFYAVSIVIFFRGLRTKKTLVIPENQP